MHARGTFLFRHLAPCANGNAAVIADKRADANWFPSR